MKIIISENRLGRIINTYIHSNLGGLQPTYSDYWGSTYYFDKNGKIRAEFDEEDNLWVKSDFIESLKNMFSLNRDTIDSIVKKYFKRMYEREVAEIFNGNQKDWTDIENDLK